MANETNNTKSMSSILPWIIAAIVLFFSHLFLPVADQ